MKKRTAVIGALVSLLPLGQPLVMRTGAVLTSALAILAVPERALAESVTFYFNRGIDKSDDGDYYGAISDYSKVIEINPRYAKAYYNRGIAKRKLGDNYGAISDYSKAIEINPSYALAFRNRSVAKENLGDLKGACDDARTAVSLGDQNEVNKKWIRNNCQ